MLRVPPEPAPTSSSARVVENIARVETVVDRFPALGKGIIVGDGVLELVGAPAGLVVELQPLRQRGHLLGLGIVGEYPRMNDRVVGSAEEVVGHLARLGGLAANHRPRAEIVVVRTQELALDLAHMTVLTGYAVAGRGGHPVLAVRLLEAEAVE